MLLKDSFYNHTLFLIALCVWAMSSDSGNDLVLHYWIIGQLPLLHDDTLTVIRQQFIPLAKLINHNRLGNLFFVTLRERQKSIEWDDAMRDQVSKIMSGFTISLNKTVFTAETYARRITCELYASLVIDNEVTHYIVLNLLEFVFKVWKDRKTSVFREASDFLVSVAVRFGYIDVVWLYAYHLMNPGREPILIIPCERGGMCDKLLVYLYALKDSQLQIRTLQGVYTSRVVCLYRCIMYLLLQEKRYEDAVQVQRFMRRSLGVYDALPYLYQSKLYLPLEYAAFLKTFGKAPRRCYYFEEQHRVTDHFQRLSIFV